MVVYCAGNCHVWIGASSLCTCEAHRVAMMYGLPQNYNPFGPHAPQPPAPDVPLNQFKAAQSARATHLSADGERIYCQRFDAILEARWQGNEYGAWWVCNGLPADAVLLDKE